MALVGTLGRIFNVQVRFGADTTGFLGKMAQMGAAVTNVGRTLSMGLTLPIVAVGVVAVTMAAKFEHSMHKVAAVTQGTAEEMEHLSSVAQELGRTTKFSASQAADGMTFLAMAGFEVNEIAGAMPAVLDLAAAANMDLATAADIASNVMTGYEMEVSELSGAIDVMAGAFTGANTDLQQLGEAMSYVGPIAAGLEIPFEQTAAVLGMFGNAGIQASRAGTSLRMGLLRLIDPPGDAAAALDTLGVAIIDVDGNFRDITKIMIDMANVMEERGYTSTERLATMMQIFGRRAGAPFASVLSQGTDELVKFVDALEDTQGLAKDIADTQMEGLNGQITKLKSAFEGLMIVIGEAGILGALTELAEKTTKWISELAEADPAMIKLAVQIAGIIALLGPLLMLLGQIIAIAPAIGAAVTFMFGPWGIVIAGAIGLITLAINAYNKSAKEAQEKTDKFRESLETQLGTLEQTNTDIETLNTSFNELEESIVDNEEKFDLFKDKLQEIIDNNPKFISVLEDIEIHGGELYDTTGKLIGSWDELLGKWDRFDSGNVVIEIDKITRAIDRLARAEFMESRSFIESVGRFLEVGGAFLDPTFTAERGRPSIIERRAQEWEDIVTNRLNEMEQDILSGFLQAPSIMRGIFPPEDGVVIEDEDEEESRVSRAAREEQLADAQNRVLERYEEWIESFKNYISTVNLAKDKLEYGLITEEEYNRQKNQALSRYIDSMMRLNVEQELAPENLEHMNLVIALYTSRLERQEQALAQIEWDEQVDAWRAVREANIAYYEELREMTWRMQGLFQPTDMDMDAVDRFYSLVEEAGREKAEAWWRDEYGDKPFPDADDTGIKDKADKLSDQLGDALLNGIDGLIRAVASGNIGQAIAKLFNQLGNIIAQHVSKMISASIGGGGMFGSIMGAVGGGIIGMGISLLGGLFGGEAKMPGRDTSNLNYTYITNWEDFFKFGFTLPASFVLSGRSDLLGVDPHGRVLDQAFGDWEDGGHFTP